jgi:hypothetical protein
MDYITKTSPCQVLFQYISAQNPLLKLLSLYAIIKSLL